MAVKASVHPASWAGSAPPCTQSLDHHSIHPQHLAVNQPRDVAATVQGHSKMKLQFPWELDHNRNGHPHCDSSAVPQTALEMNPNTSQESVGGLSSSHLPPQWSKSSFWQAKIIYVFKRVSSDIAPQYHETGTLLGNCLIANQYLPKLRHGDASTNRNFSHCKEPQTDFRQQKMVSKETWKRLTNSDCLNVNGWSSQWPLDGRVGKWRLAMEPELQSHLWS